MLSIQDKILLQIDKKSLVENTTQMHFSHYRLFSELESKKVKKCYKAIGKYLTKKSNVVLYGINEFSKQLLEHTPKLKKKILGVYNHPNSIPPEAKTAFICEKSFIDLGRAKKEIPNHIEIITPEVIKDINWKLIPINAWVPREKSIYPIDIPEIEFLPNQDLIVIDSPARNLAFLPNGLAYVHNALKKTSLKFQTVDLDIIIYHRYHTHRILDRPDELLTPSGKKMHDDPWLAEAYLEWQKIDVVEYFGTEINEVTEKLIKANPKILGLSLQSCNKTFVTEVVKGVKKALPDIVILVGGFSCYQPSIGRKAFPECDYMCIGEADLTIGPLVEALARGERPKDTPGVLSRYDSPGYTFTNYPIPLELDSLEMAKYDWTDIKLYRNHNDYQLTPIIASRGCRWSRCTFCAERFYWRIRDPKLVVDEFEYLADNGCDLFMFNESDLNGLPEKLVEICDEIVRRGLKLKLTGQLRIHKKADRKYYDSLRAGGFVALRFGVDAWSKHTLRLQMKGYTMDMIHQNLKDCFESGIYTEVNTVIGIPGETEADIDESIEMMLKCKPYIGRHANMNTLIFAIGSVYWEDPERFKIKFRDHTKAEIFKKHPSCVPADLWYSEEPYIDQDIRTERYKKVIKSLHENNVDMGPFLKEIFEHITEQSTSEYGKRDLKKPINREDFASKIQDSLTRAKQKSKLTTFKLAKYNNEIRGYDSEKLSQDLSKIKKKYYKIISATLTDSGPILLMKKVKHRLSLLGKSID